MADMSTLSQIAVQMVPDLPGCELSTIMRYLRRACNRFCSDTEIWMRDIEVTLVSGTDTYDISLADSMVRRIKEVRVLDLSVDATADRYAGRSLEMGYVELFRGPDRIYLNPRVAPTDADDGNTLVVKVVDVPDTTADLLDAEFLTRWADGIRARAMFELSVLPERPWSSADSAGLYNIDYLDCVNAARFENVHEHKSVDARMCAPSFI